MHFPKFWARGDSDGVSCWRWSDVSVSEAKERALQQAKKIASLLSGQPSPLQRYGYADRPLREEVLEEIRSRSDTLAGAVTRNSYGCMVLNTSHAMFLDIDSVANSGRVHGGVWDFLKRLFGTRQPVSQDSARDKVQEHIQQWLRLNPTWGIKLYQTAAGYRVLVTHALYEPSKIKSEGICDTLEVDPLYRKLCETQQSFRARLTPKPWRIRIDPCPTRWPWETREREEEFRRWEEEYTQRCEQYATCKFCGNFGASELHPEVVELLKHHDRATKAHSGLPLA